MAAYVINLREHDPNQEVDSSAHVQLLLSCGSNLFRLHPPHIWSKIYTGTLVNLILIFASKGTYVIHCQVSYCTRFLIRFLNSMIARAFCVPGERGCFCRTTNMYLTDLTRNSFQSGVSAAKVVILLGPIMYQLKYRNIIVACTLQAPDSENASSPAGGIWRSWKEPQ